MNDAIAQKLAMLTHTPGVYIMKDVSGDVIYVGKAISLKNRVRQYFQSGAKDPKVTAMVAHIESFDYLLTNSETEALTLESNLIKRYQPRYNILLKDDKHFPYVRIDLQSDFPRVEVVRKVKKDQARYFGPYMSTLSLRESIDTIKQSFPIRTCKKNIASMIERNERPCLMYHIGRCCGPCTGKISRDEYHQMLKNVSDFLLGDTKSVLEDLRRQMMIASQNMEFEKAAQLRDRIKAIEGLNQKQAAIEASTHERDAFAIVRAHSQTAVFALFVRSGKISEAEKFVLKFHDETDSEILESFLKQFYSKAPYVPKEVLINCEITDKDTIEQWLSQKRGSKVSLIRPQKGAKRKLLDIAELNGKETLEKLQLTEQRKQERTLGALAQLQTMLGLDEMPRRIEAFDNSNMLGRDAVSAMIVFEDAQPEKKDYRRFKIKTVEGPDDYASMYEVIHRRFSRFISEQGSENSFAKRPDVVLIDGGKGQLSAAKKAIDDLGVDVVLIALAERSDLIYALDREEPIRLEKQSPLLLLLERIRDEAHRFAISYHRGLRGKNSLVSALDGIKGVGTKRKKALFEAFVTIDNIKQASVEQLAAVEGMNILSAQAVYEFFNRADG